MAEYDDYSRKVIAGGNSYQLPEDRWRSDVGEHPAKQIRKAIQRLAPDRYARPHSGNIEALVFEPMMKAGLGLEELRLRHQEKRDLLALCSIVIGKPVRADAAMICRVTALQIELQREFAEHATVADIEAAFAVLAGQPPAATIKGQKIVRLQQQAERLVEDAASGLQPGLRRKLSAMAEEFRKAIVGRVPAVQKGLPGRETPDNRPNPAVARPAARNDRRP